MINEQDRSLMCAESKIGLLATVDEEGSPHISFISSIRPHGERQLIAGQFCAGLSKNNFRERHKVGFLIFSPDMEIWRGRAKYTSSATSGPEYEMYNKQPLFRYNSYFGIGTVHYFNLVDITPRENLTMPKIILGAVKTRLAKPLSVSSQKNALNKVSSDMFNQIDGLKFISYLDEQGYPVLVPLIQAAAAGRDRIVFAYSPYRQELQQIPPGVKAAIFFVNLKMESVLVKGIYSKAGSLCPRGILDIEKVYNSMPPQPGYIYPRSTRYEKVIDF
jgi:hypothetical protein